MRSASNLQAIWQQLESLARYSRAGTIRQEFPPQVTASSCLLRRVWKTPAGRNSWLGSHCHYTHRENARFCTKRITTFTFFSKSLTPNFLESHGPEFARFSRYPMHPRSLMIDFTESSWGSPAARLVLKLAS